MLHRVMQLPLAAFLLLRPTGIASHRQIIGVPLPHPNALVFSPKNSYFGKSDIQLVLTPQENCCWTFSVCSPKNRHFLADLKSLCGPSFCLRQSRSSAAVSTRRVWEGPSSASETAFSWQPCCGLMAQADNLNVGTAES